MKLKRLSSLALLGLLATLGSPQISRAQWNIDYYNCDAILPTCPALAQLAYNSCVAAGRVNCQSEYNATARACEDAYHDCADCQGGGGAVWRGFGSCETECVTSEGCSIGYTRSEPDGTEALIDNCGCYQTYSPVVIPLRGGLPRLSSVEEGVRFSMKPGTVRQVAWPRRTTAWLALDRNGNGIIDDGSELFGNTTPLLDGTFADNGYAPLAEFDANQDGKIDVTDPVFPELRLWHDHRRDGISDPDELLTLESAGVVSISVRARPSQRTDRWGNHYLYRSSVECSTAPHRRQSFDVFPVTREP